MTTLDTRTTDDPQNTRLAFILFFKNKNGIHFWNGQRFFYDKSKTETKKNSFTSFLNGHSGFQAFNKIAV